MVCIPFCFLAPLSFFRAGPESDSHPTFVDQFTDWFSRSEGFLLILFAVLLAVGVLLFTVGQRKSFSAWAPRGLVLLSSGILSLYVGYQAARWLFLVVQESLIKFNPTLALVMGILAASVCLIFSVAALLTPVLFFVLRKPVYRPTKY